MLSQESLEQSGSLRGLAIPDHNIECELSCNDRPQSFTLQKQLRKVVEPPTAQFVVDVDDDIESIANERYDNPTQWKRQNGRDECTVSSSSETSTCTTHFSTSSDSSSYRSLLSCVASVGDGGAGVGVVQRKRTRDSLGGSSYASSTSADNGFDSAAEEKPPRALDVGGCLLLSQEAEEEEGRALSVSGGGADPLGTLSDEQLFAFRQVVREGRSVFITGGAGTGKSYLLRQIIASLPATATFVTATTGLAAMNLSGTTLHRFAGCGLVEPTDNLEEVIAKMQTHQRSRAAWRACQTLIIDEVSMLDGWLFTLLEQAARRIRQRPNDPFGGIQLVLSGDFLQLPPVTKQRQHIKPVFCFESEAWLRVNPHICLLTKPFRQKNVASFRLLNQIRFGEMDTESLRFLASLSTRTAAGQPPSDHLDHKYSFNPHDPVQAVGDPSSSRISNRPSLVDLCDEPSLRAFNGYTLLRSKRVEVNCENAYYFEQLNTEVFMYRGFHTGLGVFPSQNIQEVVELRVGCRVMLIKNHETVSSLVNGSTGTVSGFVDIARGFHFPGSSLTREDVLRLCCGRGRDPDRRHTKLPIVKFDVPYPSGGGPSPSSAPAPLEIVVEPRAWLEMSGTTVLSSTVQLPLILSYAITIHKSQGMSLTKVDIDLKNCFEDGQAYVALSRCTDFNYVHLGAFDVGVIAPNLTALAYYKALAIERRRGQQGQSEGEGKGKEEGKGRGEGSVSARLDGLRRGLAPGLGLAAQLRRRAMQGMRPAETARNAKLVMDASALSSLITAAGSALKYDLIFGKQGNMMRLPNAVWRFLLDAAAPPCEGGDARDVAAEALALIQRAKSDFVFDAQGEDQRRPVPVDPLPGWRPYAAVLPLLDPHHPLRAPPADPSEGIRGGGRSMPEESAPSNVLSGEEWRFVLNENPHETLLCREVLEYSIYLRERYGPDVRVCTDSLTLAAYSMAFGLQVVSMGFSASSTSLNAHLES